MSTKKNIATFFKDKENFIFLFPVALLFFMQLCAIFKWTFYGKSVQAASGWWWLVALPCYAIAVAIIIRGENSRKGIDQWWIIGAAFFWILALCALAGFNFSIA